MAIANSYACICKFRRNLLLNEDRLLITCKNVLNRIDACLVVRIIKDVGAGLSMTPIIVFMVSSVPARLGGTVSATGVFFRFTGFCTSIALINYFQLAKGSAHYNRFQQELSDVNPMVAQRMMLYQQLLTSRDMAPIKPQGRLQVCSTAQ
jgi:hypothetical protein